jgi:hypothetical protein
MDRPALINKVLMNRSVINLITKIERLMDYKIEKILFKMQHGYNLNLKNPKSYNEKIIWKKIHDRNPLLSIVADKYKVRDYLRKVLGKNEAEKILIPLLFVTDRPETIPFYKLPEEYIIKANHGSGWNIIVEKNSAIDKKAIIRKCNYWLGSSYGAFGNEWAYQEIKRKIIIEKLVRDEKGKLPTDYKFHMIHGECIFIQIDFDRHTNHKRSLFDENWNLINALHAHPIGSHIKKPDNLEEMLALSKLLAKPFDCIRVDLYSINNKIYFGELTNYHGGGTNNFTPISVDFELGKSWKLEENYWLKKQ